MKQVLEDSGGPRGTTSLFNARDAREFCFPQSPSPEANPPFVLFRLQAYTHIYIYMYVYLFMHMNTVCTHTHTHDIPSNVKDTFLPEASRFLRGTAGLKKNQVDEIVLVGGSTRIPKVQQLIKDSPGDRQGSWDGNHGNHTMDYPLVNIQKTMENHLFDGKIHYKSPCSIAMLNYQRVRKKWTYHVFEYLLVI